MVLWIFFPISLAFVSFVGTWTVPSPGFYSNIKSEFMWTTTPFKNSTTIGQKSLILLRYRTGYGIAYSNNHVCSLADWSGENFCVGNQTSNCCFVPTISSSGTYAPENSLFTATINAGSFLFFLFCLFHHAHVMAKSPSDSTVSRIAALFGVVAALGAFIAGNCNPDYLALLHYLGAALSFLCICFYSVLLTAITRRCQLSGFEKILFPYRFVSTVIQAIVTICYTILFAQDEYLYQHMSAIFEWMLSVNLQLFELSYAIEFYYFSSYMISNLLGKMEEQKPLVMS